MTECVIGGARLYIKDSQDMSELEDGEVDLIITTPPEWDYQEILELKAHGTFEECLRVLKPGGFFVYNIGHPMIGDQLEKDLHLGMLIKTLYPSMNALIIANVGFNIVSDVIGYYENQLARTEKSEDLNAFLLGNRYEHWYIFAKGPWTLKRPGMPNLFQMKEPGHYTDVGACVFLIDLFTEPGDLVLDPFAGSGTIGAVATDLGRDAVMYEIDPRWEEVITRRMPYVKVLKRESFDKSSAYWIKRSDMKIDESSAFFKRKDD